MSPPTSEASWPAGIPEIRQHPTDLSQEELREEAKGWLLFVRVRKSLWKCTLHLFDDISCVTVQITGKYSAHIDS